MKIWQPLEELLQCSRVQQRSLSDLETDLTEENISSVDLPLIGNLRLVSTTNANYCFDFR